MKNLSLYIHIPFCVKKCHYCDFLSAACDENTKQNYVEALCREITQRAEEFKDRRVDTIFFGGGTPSLLSGEQMTQIMSAVKTSFQVLPEAEISMEMNPGTVAANKLEVYKNLGINRLSIGLQSADNEELKILGRIHTWESFLESWKMVREAGFSNVNIDLMSALPGQTLESYEKTLRKVLALRPEHISAYSLIVEEGTLFYQWYGEEHENAEYLGEKAEANDSGKNPVSDSRREKQKSGDNQEEITLSEVKKRKLPDEITDRRMYELTKKLLEERGYYRYEISNYALKGHECKHNTGYWKRKEYLGLGLGAASLLLNIRSSNISDLQMYLRTVEETEISGTEKWWQEEELGLSREEQMEEFMFLGLRMMDGISPSDFGEQFGQSLQEVYGKPIRKLEKQGLLEFHSESGKYALTEQGIDVSNQVFVEFMFPV